jgi:hypothetical protein
VVLAGSIAIVSCGVPLATVPSDGNNGLSGSVTAAPPQLSAATSTTVGLPVMEWLPWAEVYDGDRLHGVARNMTTGDLAGISDAAPGAEEAFRTPATPSRALSGTFVPAVMASGQLVGLTDYGALVEVIPGLSFSDQGIQEGEYVARPEAILVDRSSGKVTSLGVGYGVVLSGGRLAFSELEDSAGIAANIPVRARLMVVELGDAGVPGPDRVVWTEEPGYWVAATWWGDSLLAYRIGMGEEIELHLFKEPGRSTMLPGQLVTLIDGTQIAILATAGGLITLDLGSAEVVDKLDVDTSAPIAYGGASAADMVFARADNILVSARVDKAGVFVGEARLVEIGRGFIQEMVASASGEVLVLVNRYDLKAPPSDEAPGSYSGSTALVLCRLDGCGDQVTFGPLAASGLVVRLGTP